MKSIVKFTSGLLFKTVAAPFVVTGAALQEIAKGTIYVGNATLELGQTTELKGHRFAETGEIRVSDAKAEMLKSREQRKLEREDAKRRAENDRVFARAKRIQQLEMACAMRKQLEDLDLGALARMAESMKPQFVTAEVVNG